MLALTCSMNAVPTKNDHKVILQNIASIFAYKIYDTLKA